MNTQNSSSAVRAFDADAYTGKLESCARRLREKADFKPEILLVLGSGLGEFAGQIEIEKEIPYSDIEEFPVSTVAGHEGKLILGSYAGKKLAVMKGRVHYYEGYDIHDVVFPLRVIGLLGAGTVILTNAVGGINKDYAPGDFVAVKDHISSFIPSPLIGKNLDNLGERFTDMSRVYDKELRDLVKQIGKENGITVHSGVFLQTTGPQYETPAEIRMFRTLGADTVGMSTAVEAIAARHMGMRVCAVNCVTNMAAGIGKEKLSHKDVSKTADSVSREFTLLIKQLLERC